MTRLEMIRFLQDTAETIQQYAKDISKLRAYKANPRDRELDLYVQKCYNSAYNIYQFVNQYKAISDDEFQSINTQNQCRTYRTHLLSMKIAYDTYMKKWQRR